MEIKFKKRQEEFKYILSFDLAKRKTGWALCQINPFVVVKTGLVETKKDSVMPWVDFYEQINGILDEVEVLCGKETFFVTKERCPNQAGARSTIEALQRLAQAHAIFDLVIGKREIYCYDYVGVFSMSVKHFYKKLLGRGAKDLPDKEDINTYLREQHPEFMLKSSECDISDAIGVAQTLLQHKWNQDIETEKKAYRKALKDARSERGKKNAAQALELLEKLKI